MKNNKKSKIFIVCISILVFGIVIWKYFFSQTEGGTQVNETINKISESIGLSENSITGPENYYGEDAIILEDGTSVKASEYKGVITDEIRAKNPWLNNIQTEDIAKVKALQEETDSMYTYNNTYPEAAGADNCFFALVPSSNDDDSGLFLHPMYCNLSEEVPSRYAVLMFTDWAAYVDGGDDWGEYEGFNIDMASNSDCLSFILEDRYFDDIIPYSANYCWTIDADSPDDLHNSLVHFVVFNLDTKAMEDAFECQVIYDGAIFTLGDIYRTSSSPEYGVDNEISSATSAAIAFAQSTLELSITEEQMPEVYYSAKVDTCTTPYFFNAKNTNKESTMMTRIKSDLSNVYIVTLKCTDDEAFTFYVEHTEAGAFEVIAYDMFS